MGCGMWNPVVVVVFFFFLASFCDVFLSSFLLFVVRFFFFNWSKISHASTKDSTCCTADSLCYRACGIFSCCKWELLAETSLGNLIV